MKPLCTQHTPTRNRFGAPYCDRCGVWLSEGREDVPPTERVPQLEQGLGGFTPNPLRSDYTKANTKAEAQVG